MTHCARTRHLATLLLSVGLAATIEMAITVEWTSPACSRAYQAWNGPMSPAFGMPLPYLRPSLVTSLEYLVMPHVYILNILILAMMTFPAVSAIVSRLRSVRIALWLGAALCAVVATWRIFLLSLPVWVPERTIAIAERYSEFRPVGVATAPHSQCRPSAFWFPERKWRVGVNFRSASLYVGGGAMPLPRIASTSQTPLVAGRRRAVQPPAATGSVQLNMTMQHQQQANWCWAAVSVSVKLFYSPGFAITQCQQANRVLSLTTCCTTGGGTVCNIPWYLDVALSGLGNMAQYVGNALPFTDVSSQINSSRPLGCRIGWFGGGGHFVAIDGCDPSSPAQLLTIKDPFYGTSVVPYNTFATAYQGAGSWTSSYETQP